MTIPEALVVRLDSGRGLHGTVWLLEVWCPYCAKVHTHGGGGDRTLVADFLGHRVSHCTRSDLAGGRGGHVHTYTPWPRLLPEVRLFASRRACPRPPRRKATQ